VRPGVRLGIDVGTVRIGVARSDASATLAVPVETVPRGDGDLDRLAALVAEHEAVEVLVGLPLTLQGKRGPAARAARDFAHALADRLTGLPVRLVDERMSTVTAARGLREAGRPGRTTRSVVDQAAAVVIVQYAIDSERATGRAPGELVQE
jgi:putative pre-16S rRNA nuclease